MDLGVVKTYCLVLIGRFPDQILWVQPGYDKKPNRHFENGIAKVQNRQEDTLDGNEARALGGFRRDFGKIAAHLEGEEQEIAEEEHLTDVQRMKRARSGRESKKVFSEQRQNMSPMVLEAPIYLKANRGWWTKETVSDDVIMISNNKN